MTTLNLKIFARRTFPGNLLNTKANSLNLEVSGLHSETVLIVGYFFLFFLPLILPFLWSLVGMVVFGQVGGGGGG